MTIHFCKITNYKTEQLTHFNNHLKSTIYKLAYEKLLLEVNKMTREKLRKLHKEEGLKNYSKLKKPELIEKYINHINHIEIKTKKYSKEQDTNKLLDINKEQDINKETNKINKIKLLEDEIKLKKEKIKILEEYVNNLIQKLNEEKKNVDNKNLENNNLGNNNLENNNLENNNLENIEINLINPILKWAGGKTQIIKEVINKFPNEINNYYEAFIGGGSVFLELLKLIETDKIKINGKIYLNDLNSDLINLYSIIKKDTSILFSNIDGLIDNYNKAKMVKYEARHKYNINLDESIEEYVKKSKSDVYYYYRDLYNTTKDTNLKTALFLFLNKTCYRGLFREGPNGFNVPFGNYKNPTIYNKDEIIELNKLFNKYNVQFLNLDFEKFSDNIEKDDFVYFDPPYYPLKKTSFTSYKDDSFYEKHEVLVNLCNKLNISDIKFVHSNSYCKFNLDKYKDYDIQKIECKRRINSKNPKDKDFEVIINN